ACLRRMTPPRRIAEQRHAVIAGRLGSRRSAHLGSPVRSHDSIAFQLGLYHMEAGSYVTKSAMSSHIVAYYRVSTHKQGRSGLGLEAQRKAVTQFAASEGLEIAQEFIEVETGKGADVLNKRPQLAAALRMAKRLKAEIVVAKLDRLSRDVAFIADL